MDNGLLGRFFGGLPGFLRLGGGLHDGGLRGGQFRLEPLDLHPERLDFRGLLFGGRELAGDLGELFLEIIVLFGTLLRGKLGLLKFELQLLEGFTLVLHIPCQRLEFLPDLCGLGNLAIGLAQFFGKASGGLQRRLVMLGRDLLDRQLVRHRVIQFFLEGFQVFFPRVTGVQLLTQCRDAILGRKQVLLHHGALLDPLGFLEILAAPLFRGQRLLRREQVGLKLLDLLFQAPCLGRTIGSLAGRGGGTRCHDRDARPLTTGPRRGRRLRGRNSVVSLRSLAGRRVRGTLQPHHPVTGFLQAVFHDGLLPRGILGHNLREKALRIAVFFQRIGGIPVALRSFRLLIGLVSGEKLLRRIGGNQREKAACENKEGEKAAHHDEGGAKTTLWLSKDQTPLLLFHLFWESVCAGCREGGARMSPGTH